MTAALEERVDQVRVQAKSNGLMLATVEFFTAGALAAALARAMCCTPASSSSARWSRSWRFREIRSDLRVALGAELLEQRVDFVEEEVEPAVTTNGFWQDVGMSVVAPLRCTDDAQC